MYIKSLSNLPIILTALVAVPSHAQTTDPQAQAQAPAPLSDQGSAYRYGYGAYYDFDRGLLSAVNACAYRAARARLGRVIIHEVDRTSANRFQVAGRSVPFGYRPGSPSGYYDPGNDPDYRYGYSRYTVSFRCTADEWGQIISWTTNRR